ncbi:3-deoxy-manno-octulosonate cytidylyltransferase [Halomonas salipaludis]|uniref:3-deoxy-manno-octulosonate cytidylyltransferase n=1 Tax=Halomonas salipaludis TaxID=2032625 RepID=A0A2A2F3C8_9GAMM|nr:3-deoxy-manno-octulosonate cytidylyltransferase [Halomonas salipaludis]PAU79458.1 3-deoxy-manno-octulosonate cytidylyltransferase [Halomonas salipaludis]
MKCLILIPARYRSSRYPGKPLVDVAGKTLLRRVWERCEPVLGADSVIVATDDDRIATHCEEQGMRWVMTSSSCLTGTDRLAEAAQELEADLYINVQGDEPLIRPEDIQAVIEAAKQYPGEILNATCEITHEADYFSKNVPKVVARPDGRLLYMSRSPIPGNKQREFTTSRKQVCIYAFPPEALAEFAAKGMKTPLEASEDIEILRFLEMGYEIRMIPVSGSSIAIDEPEDVARVIAALDQNGMR